VLKIPRHACLLLGLGSSVFSRAVLGMVVMVKVFANNQSWWRLASSANSVDFDGLSVY
jgi:hypothetical protein